VSDAIDAIDAIDATSVHAQTACNGRPSERLDFDYMGGGEYTYIYHTYISYIYTYLGHIYIIHIYICICYTFSSTMGRWLHV